MMEITVLCKVVDNFGDIGVCWRMINQIKEKLSNFKWGTGTKLNLIVDDLVSFNKINHLVEIDKSWQVVEGVEVYYWKDQDFCHKAFSGKWEKLQVILECFQCGRPEWMEKILFEEGLEKTVNIIMIDYLTAEDYAEDFHLLQSLTRSAKVQKINFMPGFTEKTGGLLIDKAWEEPVQRLRTGPTFFFTYEKNWEGILRGINKAFEERKLNNKLLVAQGRGKESVLEGIKGLGDGSAIEIEELPYLDLSKWDELMKTCSVLFIRGEESMSRACLSGIPFVWHAYPQSDEYQMVKMNALLEKLKPHFEEGQFKVVSRIWTLINMPEAEVSQSDLEEAAYDFIIKQEELAKGFYDFSLKLRKNGDLAVNLMTFIEKKYIIEEQ